MSAGDTLIFATDGLGEARNGSGEYFEASGLGDVVAQMKGEAPEAAVQLLADRAIEFDAGESLTDDLTIIAVQRANS